MAGKGLRIGRGGRQQQQQQRQQQHGFVTEALRVRVAKILEDFRASDREVYTFEPCLSKQERSAIHQLCRKMGMISRSSGNGAKRCLSLYKSKRKQQNNRNEEEPVTSLTFGEESNVILQDLFTRYPPDDGDLNEDISQNNVKTTTNSPWMQDTSFCRPSFSKDEIKKKIETLSSKINGDLNLRKTAADIAKLPIASYKHVITSSLEAHQVVLISGETGCGKTTQVPQYILAHMWSKCLACKVVCTQPRRISAISVAERISYERGETIGDTVGYKIRLESKGGKQSSIMFCTNGILLRLLIGRGNRINKKNPPAKDTLLEISHIIVDEIHERDKFSDIMLAIIRSLEILDVVSFCSSLVS